MYKDLIIGLNSIVEFKNESKIHYINFDNAAKTTVFTYMEYHQIDYHGNINTRQAYRYILS